MWGVARGARQAVRISGPPRPTTWSRRGDRFEREASGLAKSVLEPRFGFDFSRVRVHHDDGAARAARAAGALAYTVGNDIVWGAAAAPDSLAGRGLLAHELGHIAAGHTRAAPTTGFREELPERPRLPTVSQRRDIMEAFNPQASEGPAGTVDEAAFTTALREVGRTIRGEQLGPAQDVQSAPVSLSTADLDDVVTIAEEEVRRAYGSLVARDVDLAAVRARIRYIPGDPGTSPAADEATLSTSRLGGLALSAVRIHLGQDARAQAVIDTHNVRPGSRAHRDLYARALRAIRDEAPDEWRTIALSFRGWNLADMTLVQRHIIPLTGESAADARRRGRWMNLGTAIHEMLHAATHRDFRVAADGIERRELAVEGFTEFFTRRLYAEIVDRAAGDPALRLRIEGAAGPAMTPPARASYGSFFSTVENVILPAVNGNPENLRQAYFRGRVEYIGLGRWNELARGLPTGRQHAIGGAVLLEAREGALQAPLLAHASWGYLVWGHSGAFQFDLRAGAGITYLSEGQRVGGGPELSFALRGSHLYVGGSGLLQVSGAATGAGLERSGLDAVLRLEAGAQIGLFHVGPTVGVLVPITDRDAAGRSVRVFGGLGVSFVFGN